MSIRFFFLDVASKTLHEQKKKKKKDAASCFILVLETEVRNLIIQRDMEDYQKFFDCREIQLFQIG